MERRAFLKHSGKVLAGLAALPHTSLAGGIFKRGEMSVFKAGAFAQDINPEYFPIAVNGNFKPYYAEKVIEPLHARALVLDSGQERIAMVVVDSCVFDRELMDTVKAEINALTSLPTERIFISTTHAHSAPSAVGVLGTEAEERYRAWLPGRIAAGVREAVARLEPAQVGWGVEQLPDVPQSRRWIARPDKVGKDPFGEMTVRANMHPGYRNPDWQEPTGPVSPDLNVLAVRRPDGSPIALFGSFSIHYVGAPSLSADYFGLFAQKVTESLAEESKGQPFVGILSNGASGDVYLNDYTRTQKKEYDRFTIADTVAEAALKAYRSMRWFNWLPLGMLESEIELKIREPRVEWAKKIKARIAAGEEIDVRTSVYANEQMLLAASPPTRKLKLQTLRLGDLAIAAIPCEVYGITGMRIAQASPFPHTFTIMLANGCEGYLPPPEQMALGGYNTWLARTSCLEAQAEPKIVKKVSEMLKRMGGGLTASRRPKPLSAYATAVMASKPLAFWRLNELDGPSAANLVPGGPTAAFGMPTCFGMPGAQAPDFPGFGADNRVPHFVGAPLTASLPRLDATYTVELWFYNCMPADARGVAGYLFARGANGDRLALGGTAHAPGRLIFHTGKDVAGAVGGSTEIPLRNWVPLESWHHVAMVCTGKQVTIYLDGQTAPELQTERAGPELSGNLWFGGTDDSPDSFQGRLDEIAIYGRALDAAEIAAHYRAARIG